jgi:hypothetical protein
MDCCVGGYDGEPARVFQAVWRVARRRHRCCECQRYIPPGARYLVESGLWDKGRPCWERYKTCELCHSIRLDRFNCGHTFGMMWYDLKQALSEMCDGGYEDCARVCKCNDWLDPPTHPITVKKKGSDP